MIYKQNMNMKSKVKTFGFLVFIILIISQSCEKENDNENDPLVSSYGENESHNMGQNCMSCHKQGGNGEGWFNLAGTIYDDLLTNTYPNATVYLFTGPNGTGTQKYTVQVDAKGNFYTTENIDFEDGLYPAVQGNQTPNYMVSSVSNGQCNSCHGVSTENIWTD